ncbi:M50 family peptidase [Halobacillus trueperi]|uniref:Peptidase M50B-like n=2 Tax=Halobacillus TaxID=45667 RepID=A0A1H0EX38_HALAD|nr:MULTISPECIES: M50 family metallopeptidase [Halobacillus]RDY71015.1 M50 family peptidase [Halobacillus trueperi]SDN86938.1 Peptidase M50B-like [Halobacillus aidingensis]
MKLQVFSALILALLLTQLPVVGKYFAILNTMIHESGHSLMALITGGEVRRISLLPNTSGFALTGHTSWIGQVLTSMAGYVFASFFAFVFFFLISRGQYKWMIYILMAFLAINLLFWVRNVYGLFWILTFGAGFLWLLRTGHEQVVQYVLLFLASLVLVESVTSAFEVMWISFVSPGQAGDAANLAKATAFIPAPLWGLAFFVQALYFALLSIKRVFPF